jgi:hypothetical protein
LIEKFPIPRRETVYFEDFGRMNPATRQLEHANDLGKNPRHAPVYIRAQINQILNILNGENDLSRLFWTGPKKNLNEFLNGSPCLQEDYRAS